VPRAWENLLFASVLIGLLLALVSLEAAPPDSLPDPAPVLAGIAALAVGVFLAGLLVGALVLRRGAPSEGDEQRFLRRVGLMAKAYRFLVVGAYAAMLFALDWSALAAHWAGAPGWTSLAFLLVLTPFVALLGLSWTALYWADRRLRALVFARAGVAVAPPAWTLPGYLVFLARQYLLVALVPMAVLLACRDLLAHLFGPTGEPLEGLALLGCLAAATILAGPWIRLCWPTQPFPEGDLRSRLLALGRRAGVRVADILLWRTNRSIANGCMVGGVGPLRYILITDALVLALPNEELEAVFAHEMGHIKHRHVRLYLVLALGAMGASVLATQAVDVLTGSPAAVTAALMAAAVAYWWFLFGFVSRRCELESDLYAVRMSACPAGCMPADAAPDGNASGGSAGICEHRVAVFTSALRRIARLNGAAETARGWRHFSVARRCRFLLGLLVDPEGARRFERFMGRLKVGVLLVALALVAAAACMLAAASVSEPDYPEDPAGPEDVFPPTDRWIVGLVDRHEVDAVALGAPQFDGDADAALELDDGRPPRLGGRASPRENDVVVQNPRRHAVAVHPQAERARLHGPEGGQIHELQAAVGRRLG